MNEFIGSLYDHVTKESRIPISETARRTSRMDKIYKELTTRLDGESMELLNKYLELSEQISCDYECRAFANGIKTAVQTLSCVIADY